MRDGLVERVVIAQPEHRKLPSPEQLDLGRVRRSALAPRYGELRFLLHSGPDASLLGQKYAGFLAPADGGPRPSDTNFRRSP